MESFIEKKKSITDIDRGEIFLDTVEERFDCQIFS